MLCKYFWMLKLREYEESHENLTKGIAYARADQTDKSKKPRLLECI